MIEGKTQSGFSFKIDEEKLDDMEVLEYLATVDDDMTQLPKLLEVFLGKDQKKALYDFLKEKEGKVKISSTYSILLDIFSVAGEKNKEVKKAVEDSKSVEQIDGLTNEILSISSKTEFASVNVSQCFAAEMN